MQQLNNMNKNNVLIYFLYIHLIFYEQNTWSKALNQGYKWLDLGEQTWVDQNQNSGILQNSQTRVK